MLKSPLQNRKVFASWGIHPLLDASIVAVIVFAAFVGSAMLVHSRMLAQEEHHLHRVVEAAAWKAANAASAALGPEETFAHEEIASAKKAFAGLRAERSEIASLTLFQKAGEELAGLLHVAEQPEEVPPLVAEESADAAIVLATGDSRVSLPRGKLPVAYAPVRSGTGKPTAVVRAAASRHTLLPLWLDKECFSQIVLVGGVLAALAGFFVYRSSGHFRNAFRELAAAEKRLRDVADAAGEFIWEVNADGNYTYVSDRATELLGYDSAVMIGRHPFDFVPAEDREAVFEKSNAIVRSARPFRNFEERMIRKDGALIWVTTNGVPVQDEQGRLIGYRGATMEITERKRNEEALIREKEAAQSAAIAKNQFLAMMSHEIRTPLNSVIGFAETLADSGLSSNQKDQLEMIRRNGDALLELLDDILLFSRAEAGALVMDPEPTRLRDFMEKVVSLHAPAAASKAIDLTLTVEDNVPDAFSIDQMRVRQIMLNLIGNAVKFTSKGKVSVAVGGKPVGPDQFELRFTVTDTGIGIPRDKVQALFQPFVQADSSTTRNYGGTGLGLAICRRLAGLMGGQVLLDSTGPTGSRFSFVCACPIIEFASLESVSVPEKRLVLEEAPRVLVAEDNPANSRLIQLMLKSLGCPCETVSNGRDAVAKHVESPFDVILMDVQMPVMDGMAATGEIRALEGQGKLTLKVHIIALTANAMDGDRERCLVAGMDHYLSKPLRKSELEEALRPVCQRMATQAQTLGIPPA